MMSFEEVQKHLSWRAELMRRDATKARLIPGPGAILYAVALDMAAAGLEASAAALAEKVRQELIENKRGSF